MARQMKDSGVEWIGEIPENWNVLPLGNCFEERNEKVSDYDWEPLSVTKQGIVKQLETAAKSDAHDARKKVCKKDFVINSRSDRKQSCGISAYDGSVSLINIVLSSRFLNTEYVKYLLKNYGFAEEFYRWGTGIVADLWSTKYERMKKIMLPIPKEDEQQKIADVLDEKVGEIDSVIAKTKETIEDYKKYKQAIINKVIENEKGSKYKFRYLGELKNGLNYHSTVEKENIKFLGVGNFKDFMVLNKKESFSDLPLDMELPSEYLLKNGDIIFVRSNGSRDLVGRSVMVDNIDYNLTYSGFCIRFRNEHMEVVCNKYLLYFFRSESFKQLLYKGSNGMAINNLSQDILNSVKIPIPSIQRQEEITANLDEKCSEIDKLIAKKEELLADLEDYKKSLIYEYVTGKKEVE